MQEFVLTVKKSVITENQSNLTYENKNGNLIDKTNKDGVTGVVDFSRSISNVLAFTSAQNFKSVNKLINSPTVFV